MHTIQNILILVIVFLLGTLAGKYLSTTKRWFEIGWISGLLKEWTTDEEVKSENEDGNEDGDEDGYEDEYEDDKKNKEIKDDVCIPIGEGENCWRGDDE